MTLSLYPCRVSHAESSPLLKVVVVGAVLPVSKINIAQRVAEECDHAPPVSQFQAGPIHSSAVVDVHLHLSQVLVGQLAALEVNQDVAAQQSIVEDQINQEVVVVKGETLLPSLEQEAFAQLQEEMF